MMAHVLTRLLPLVLLSSFCTLSAARADVLCARHGSLRIFQTSKCPRGWSLFPTKILGSGIVGAKGEIGTAGPVGPTGANGESGPQGPQGQMGSSGVDGAAGAPGPTGPQGLQGVQGPAGPEGQAGVSPRGDAKPPIEMSLVTLENANGDNACVVVDLKELCADPSGCVLKLVGSHPFFGEGRNLSTDVREANVSIATEGGQSPVIVVKDTGALIVNNSDTNPPVTIQNLGNDFSTEYWKGTLGNATFPDWVVSFSVGNFYPEACPEGGGELFFSAADQYKVVVRLVPGAQVPSMTYTLYVFDK